MTSDPALMREFVLRANTEHYRKILRTYLTEQERAFVNRRIAEEEATFRKAVAGSATVSSSIRVA